MEKPSISIEEYGYHRAYAEFYFNLYATEYNSKNDTVEYTNNLITIKNYIDEEISKKENLRASKVNAIGRGFFWPLVSNHKTFQKLKRFLENGTHLRILELFNNLSAKRIDRLRDITWTLLKLKRNNVKGINSYSFLWHSIYKNHLNEFSEENLQNSIFDGDWDFVGMKSSCKEALKYNDQIILYDAHRTGLKRILNYIFLNHSINKKVPEWNDLSSSEKEPISDMMPEIAAQEFQERSKNPHSPYSFDDYVFVMRYAMIYRDENVIAEIVRKIRKDPDCPDALPDKDNQDTTKPERRWIKFFDKLAEIERI